MTALRHHLWPEVAYTPVLQDAVTLDTFEAAKDSMSLEVEEQDEGEEEEETEEENARSEASLLTGRSRSRAKRHHHHSWYRASVAVLITAFGAVIVAGSIFAWTGFMSVGRDEEMRGGIQQKALILASYSELNTSWVERVPKDWSTTIYIGDRTEITEPTLYAPNASVASSSVTVLPLPHNPYNEALAYLTYITSNYHRLPSYMVFSHGHYRAWHQMAPLPWYLSALNLSALDSQHYISLRCAAQSNCLTPLDTIRTKDQSFGQGVANLINAWWANATAGSGAILPTVLASPCCAQFAITRSAVLARPLEYWETLMRPLLVRGEDWEAEGWKPVEGVGWNGHNIGFLYEWTWAVHFGKSGVWCPDEEVCRNEFFGGKIRCGGEAGEKGRWYNWPESIGVWKEVKCESELDSGDDDEWLYEYERQ